MTVKDNQGATATAPEQRYVRPADHKARDFDTLFQSLAQADDLQDEWGDTFIAFTRAMWEMMCQASAVADGWVPPSGENQSFDAPAAAQSNLDAFSKAVMDLVTRSLAADFVPQLDYDGDQFLDPDGCNADDNEDAYAMMSASAADETKAGRVMSAANHDAMGKALDTMKQGLDAVKAQHKALSDMHAQMSPDANKPDASDDEPSDNDTQDAAGDSGKDTGKGGKSARTPQAGAGAGAASDDALDSSATPSGDDNNDEENAQRLALKIQANLLALRVRKGAA